MDHNELITISFEASASHTMHGWPEDSEITPVYAVIKGTKRFLRNIRRPLSGAYQEYDYKRSVAEVERAKMNLIEHDGNYVTFYALDDDPFQFLSYVLENGYTLQTARQFFQTSSNNDFTDFHGNTSEYSCAFFYRIYDEAMLLKLKNVVSKMPQRIL